MENLTLVTNYDDWEGLYDNGKLVLEGHSIRKEEILEYLGIKVKILEADGDYLYKYGRLPVHLKDVLVAKA